jgi:hypothetical protein
MRGCTCRESGRGVEADYGLVQVPVEPVVKPPSALVNGMISPLHGFYLGSLSPEDHIQGYAD